MADWPDLPLLKVALAIDNDAKDALLEGALAAAIEGVVADCGGSPVAVTFGSGGEPSVDLIDPSGDAVIEITVTDRLARAALHRASTVYKGPDAPFGVASVFDTGGLYVSRKDPIYLSLIRGGKRRFAVS